MKEPRSKPITLVFTVSPVPVSQSNKEHFYSPLDGMLVRCRVTHLYTWLERGTERVKCLARHNTMSLARAPTQNALSGDKHTNHNATMHLLTGLLLFRTVAEPQISSKSAKFAKTCQNPAKSLEILPNT